MKFLNVSDATKRPVLIFILLAVAIFGLQSCSRTNGAGFRFASTTDPGTKNGSTNLPVAPANPNGAAPMVSFADVVSRVAPAVVTIHSQMRVRQPQQYPFMDDPFFRQFFGDRVPQPPAEQKRQALGSGVIVSADGYIVTNHHVIDGADQIKVDLYDNRTLDARVIGSDPPSDLAVLKVDASNLPVLALGDSDHVRVGDVVLALGNPLGVGQTVTMGIVSAKGRQTGLSNGAFEDFLQTDAPINQGNSGGALVSTNSELIGINSQILSPSGGSIGLGFAIPSNMARVVVSQLINGGKVRRGQLGVIVLKIPSEEATKMGATEGPGVVVYQVQSGSAADRAGLKKGDIITGLNGSPVTDPNSFRNAIAGTAPGSEVTLTVKRNGSEQQVRSRVGEFVPQAERPSEQGGEQ
jgi:Do/DeqQ family serine protease